MDGAVVEQFPVSGAQLYTETRGAGPLLLFVVGGNGDPAVFSGVAGRLAGDFTVVTYARRGFVRSPVDGPVDDANRICADVEDAVALIARHGGGPACVFGSSSGAIVTLDLVTRHPDLVSTAVVHEPPILGLLDDPDAWVARFAGIFVARLGYTQDDKDFDGLAALFADRIGFDMSAAGGDPATDITRDELASLACTVLSGFTATQHRACNVLTTVDGDIAHCRAMVDAWHTVPTDHGIADFYTARNNWLLRLKRVDGRWLITKWTIVTAAPSDGYQGVYHVAQARAAQDQAQ